MKAYGYVKGAPVLLDLWPIGAGLYLEITAAQAFERMADAAKVAGIEFHINSAYRDKASQDRLYRKYVKETAEWQKGGRLGPRPALAAIPGHSMHQSGKALDINVAGADAPALEWLRKHAADYGFVNDVPGESWHWSYLPERAAKVA